MFKKWVNSRIVLKKLNGLLKEYSKDVDKVRDILDLWIGRIERLLNYLKSLMDKIDDGVLDEGEMESAIDDAKELVKEW